MNKIDELIQQLCPEGVEFKKLGEICEYIRGITYSKKDEIQGTDGIKVLRANNISLKTNTLNLNDVRIVSNTVRVKENQKLKENDILICAASGSKDHIGKVAYIFKDMDFTFGGFMAVLRAEEILINRFLFHLLIGQSFSKYLESALNTTTINNLNSQIMNGFQIPLPPLPIQQEIVSILDKFTQLEAELEAELEARKKQYEYYRNELLSAQWSVVSGKWLMNGKEVEWKTLGEVCHIQSGGTPSKNITQYWNDGTIKWLGSTVCKNKKGVDEITNFITELGLKNSSAKIFKKETTLIALVGATIGKVAFLPYEATTNQNVAGLYPLDINKLNTSYLFYSCKALYEIFTNLSQDKLKMANLSFVRGLKIPIPPLAEQERIVGILDKFDALVNGGNAGQTDSSHSFGMTVGLPAEIEARRKQYEYYRGKLLDFKNMNTNN